MKTKNSGFLVTSNLDLTRLGTNTNIKPGKIYFVTDCITLNGKDISYQIGKHLFPAHCFTKHSAKILYSSNIPHIGQNTYPDLSTPFYFDEVVYIADNVYLCYDRTQNVLICIIITNS